MTDRLTMSQMSKLPRHLFPVRKRSNTQDRYGSDKGYVSDKDGRACLVEEYGDLKSDLGIEIKINIGRIRKCIDLVVFKNGAKHTQDQPLIEAKHADKKPSDNTHGAGQLTSYMDVSAYRRTLGTG